MSGFEDQVKKWVSLDDKLRVLAEQTKMVREQKNAACDQILAYVETNKLGNATVKISDGKLKFASSTQPAPLSLKFVHDCLGQCISNPSMVDQIMAFIKEKRQVKVKPEIRRFYVDSS